jgi:2-oxo-3-hexenedioate decarboxylase
LIILVLIKKQQKLQVKTVEKIYKNMQQDLIENAAKQLERAEAAAKATPQLSATYDFDIDKAYLIQKAGIDMKLHSGQKLTGVKMGFTSKAKMEQMGVHDMIFGQLTTQMTYENNGELLIEKFIHPRAEPEIAFLIKRDILGEISSEEVSEYIESVAPAIEIIDSRYKDFKFSLADVIADNCSSAGYVIGDWLSPNTNLQDLKIELKVDGETVQTGSSNAILGNPLESFVAAARLAKQYDIQLKKGMIVLAGAATSAIYIKKGQTVSAEIESMETVSFDVK